MNRPAASRGVRPAPGVQPELPDGTSAQVSLWWSALGSDPRSVGMTQQDWLSALDTATIIGAFYAGDAKLGGEVRIRKDALERRLREIAEVGLPETPDESAPAPGETGDELPSHYGDLRLVD